jgi:GH18 family chitinase
LSYLSCDNCPNLIDVPRHLIYYETVIDYKLENMIKENYQRYRKQQCSILINTILEELIQRTWEPVRAMEWCWDEEEKKFMSNILN